MDFNDVMQTSVRTTQENDQLSGPDDHSGDVDYLETGPSGIVRQLVKQHEQRIKMESEEANMNRLPSIPRSSTTNKRAGRLKVMIKPLNQEERNIVVSRIIEEIEKLLSDHQKKHPQTPDSVKSPTSSIIYESPEEVESPTSPLLDEYVIISTEDIRPAWNEVKCFVSERAKSPTFSLLDEIEIIYAEDATPISTEASSYWGKLLRTIKRKSLSAGTVSLIDERPILAENFFNSEENIREDDTSAISFGKQDNVREEDIPASTSLAKQNFLTSAEIEKATRDLVDAVIRNDPDTAELALYRGADLQKRDRLNRSVLHIASLNGHEAVAQKLLGHCRAEDMEAESITRDRPLHLASAYGRVAVVELLLEAGACVTPKNKDGWTPLHYAAHFGHLPVAELLVRHKSKINEKTVGNLTPLALARRNKQELIQEYLISIGGK